MNSNYPKNNEEKDTDRFPPESEANIREIERLVREFEGRLADIRRRADEIHLEDLRRSIQKQ